VNGKQIQDVAIDGERLCRKPLEWFKRNPQVRTVEHDEQELRDLGESLRVKQLQPVLARTDGTLVFGHRRLAAAKLVGLRELRVIVTDEPLSESRIKIIQLSENIHRADLTAHEKWQACEELLRLNPDWKSKDLAEHLKLSPAMVTRFLSPSKCVPAVQDALATGALGISDCYAISVAPAEQQEGLLTLKLEGASRESIEKRVRKHRRADGDAVKASSVTCRLRSGARVVVSGTAVSLSDVIEALAEAQKEAKRAQQEGLNAKTWQAVMRDRAKKAG